MYNSLKQWMIIPLSIHRCTSIDGAGDKTFSAPVVTTCYAEQSAKKVTNKDGVEIVSTTQLYLDGAELIENNDEVTFDGKRAPIEIVTAYYDNGAKDILVVHL